MGDRRCVGGLAAVAAGLLAILAAGPGLAQEGAPTSTPPGPAAPEGEPGETPTSTAPVGDEPAAPTPPAAPRPPTPADLPVPDSVWVEDVPGDNGEKLVVRWSQAERESADALYEVLLAPKKDGRYTAVGVKPSNGAWAKDLMSDVYGRGARGLEGHGLVVEPLKVYTPEEFALVILGQKDLDRTQAALARLGGEGKPPRTAKAVVAVFEDEAAGMVKLPKAAAAWTKLQDLAAKEAPPGAEPALDETIAELLKALGDTVAATRTRLETALGKDALDRAAAIFEARDASKLEDYGYVRGGYFGTDRRIGDVILDRIWYAKIRTRGVAGGFVEAPSIGEGRPVANWFNWRQDVKLVLAIVLGGLVLYFISKARKDPDIYLRRIGGLDAVDEALGRATEMGKPVLFVHGLREMKEVSTIAAVCILGEIAKHVARFDSKLLCANYDPVVLGVSQETVREGYTASGRPDAYNEDEVFLAGADQFSYVAAVDGIMLRQKPAANFYCGYFYAESLILAETGALSGAIQIAATDSFTQLPFFVTTCDYTLMGEELYAASAYLSRDPLLLGSLKGQDYAKLVMIVLLVALTAILSVDWFLTDVDLRWVRDLVKTY